MFDLEGKIAIVTGGNGGIGREIVLALATVGANVVVADLVNESLETRYDNYKYLDLSVDFKEVDVTDSKSVTDLFNYVVEKHGKIDILVNCAGVLGDSEITKISDCDWEKVIKVNLDGVFYCCREAIKFMESQNSGKIINIASVGGKSGFSFAGDRKSVV